ncbi:MAG: methylmalonyl Co-A mutase-associated GTPase MeaB [Desulfuromonadaceae bacterium]
MFRIHELADGVKQGRVRSLAKAITLIESRNLDHSLAATALLDELLPASGTFIEALGLYLTSIGRWVAVLAVDPSSQLSGGSILGDKTRMEGLARNPNAFIRPSPAGSSLGGVARRTRETMLLCEAAGYDVIMVETVGVGQSEIAVASMVDFFLLLQLPGAGDELQGIKKGVMEIADAILINKSEGENRYRAELARQQYANALHLLKPKNPGWQVPTLLCSALMGQGVREVWQIMLDFQEKMQASGEFEQKRRLQATDWMWTLVLEDLKELFLRDRQVESLLGPLQEAVACGRTTPGAAARRLLEVFRRGR